MISIWHLKITFNHDFLLSRLFMQTSKKTTKFCVICLCEGNPPIDCRLSSQRVSNAKMFPLDGVIIKYGVSLLSRRDIPFYQIKPGKYRCPRKIWSIICVATAQEFIKYQCQKQKKYLQVRRTSYFPGLWSFCMLTGPLLKIKLHFLSTVKCRVIF